ncbi:MAG: SulP family inorganic anion transporter [Patescibacteria group bacterium]
MNGIVDQLKKNWISALSVALVSVPLSLSLSIASGAGPVAGVITAIWAGLFAGIFGGSKFNIVGPAGALAGILASIAFVYGAAVLPLIAIVSGFMILVVWFFKWDRYLIFVPSAVVHGFTLGVALTIGFGQLNFALGLKDLPKHEHLISNILESLKHIAFSQTWSVIPFIVGLGLMFTILKYKPRWPNTVIVAALGILFGYLTSIGTIPLTIDTLFTKFGDLILRPFNIPTLSRDMFNQVIFQYSAVVAFVVVLETLISAKIADGMTKTKFKQRKEVLGVGLANIAAGIFGGIPASGVFARTAINVKSGATSNWSQIINAVFVAILAMVLLPGFKFIPLSVIAAILVYASIRMVATHHFKKLYKFDRSAFWISMAVAIITVVYDATAGILVGTLLALLVFARKLSSAQCNVTINEEDGQTDATEVLNENVKGKEVVYRFAGELTYINAKSHIERLQRISSDSAIVLNFRNLFYIDVDGIEALDEIIEDLDRRNQSVFVTGVNENIMKFVKDHEWFKKLVHENRVLTTTDAAIAQSKTISLKNL